MPRRKKPSRRMIQIIDLTTTENQRATREEGKNIIYNRKLLFGDI